MEGASRLRGGAGHEGSGGPRSQSSDAHESSATRREGGSGPLTHAQALLGQALERRAWAGFTGAAVHGPACARSATPLLPGMKGRRRSIARIRGTPLVTARPSEGRPSTGRPPADPAICTVDTLARQGPIGCQYATTQASAWLTGTTTTSS
eukprot:scaffold4991_cov417-Prasinococcus_capsulatus_cf.AAC.1